MLSKIANVVRGVSLGIWLGADIMTFIAAHYVFSGIVDRTTAGDIMNPILHAGGWMKVGLALLALAVQFYLRSSSDSKKIKPGFIALILAAALVLVVVLYLEPRMVELRTHFRGDPDANNPAHLLFAKLHGASMGMATLELILVAVALICALL